MGLDPDQGGADDEMEFDLGYHSDKDNDPRMSPEELSDVVILNHLGDVAEIPVDFDVRDFQEVFDVNHEDTDVFVHSMVNIIVIFR